MLRKLNMAEVYRYRKEFLYETDELLQLKRKQVVLNSSYTESKKQKVSLFSSARTYLRRRANVETWLSKESSP
jgi:type IV secretory pathway TraG/TraD family ATPase VirD4